MMMPSVMPFKLLLLLFVGASGFVGPGAAVRRARPVVAAAAEEEADGARPVVVALREDVSAGGRVRITPS